MDLKKYSWNELTEKQQTDILERMRRQVAQDEERALEEVTLEYVAYYAPNAVYYYEDGVLTWEM